MQSGVFHLQGFPEFADDEIVSVPDAKYTKGEFEVCTLEAIQPLTSPAEITIISVHF